MKAWLVIFGYSFNIESMSGWSSRVYVTKERALAFIGHQRRDQPISLYEIELEKQKENTLVASGHGEQKS